jgi:ABC-2 type transport system permease protein
VLYAAVFVTLSVFTSRALVVGLGYVLVWEGLVTTILEGTRILSIREYALSIASAVGGSSVGGRGDPLDAAVAATLSIVVLVVAVALGIWRLGRFEVGEAG